VEEFQLQSPSEHGSEGEPTFVNVPVPAEYVTEVMAFISTLVPGGRGRVFASWASGPSAPDRPGRSRGSWDEESLSLLIEDSPGVLRQAMRYLAEHPDEWILMSDLTEAIGVPNGSKGIGGALSGLSRRAQKYEGRGWPFQQRRNRHFRQAEYLMSSATAELVLRLFKVRGR
jgi:hypothetical protein